jgi:hypothetical protein
VRGGDHLVDVVVLDEQAPCTAVGKVGEGARTRP